MQTRQVNMRRWSITSPKPFEVVVAPVEEAIGRPNMAEFAAKMAAAKTYEKMQTVVRGSISENGLMEFMRLDQGAVLAESWRRQRFEERPTYYRQPAHHAINGPACPGCRVLCASDGTH
jgi:hypothetical protein